MLGSLSCRAPAARAAACAAALLAAVAVVGLAPSDRSASAQPPAGGALPPELQLVPHDAALFVHADAAKIWGGPLMKSIRAADAKLLDELTGKTKEMFGVTPDQFKTVTAFFPKFKEPSDMESFGFVITFTRPFDKADLKAKFEKLTADERPKATLVTPSDTMAVVLVGLGEEYAKPRKAGETGPLSGVIREAATGRHVLSLGTTLASLPDQIRADDVPAQVRPFQPLFKAESITAVVDLGKELTAEVRVKATTPAQAVECEKALGVLGTLAQEGLTMALKELDREAAKNPGLKDVATILKALQDGVKGAKFATQDTEARATVRVPADLPVGAAFVAAVAQVRGAATRSQSSNNLKQIALALHNYHDANNAFPPAAVCDRTGKPMLSWRVLILPYIEQDALYKEFKLDEPWDSEHNKKLLAKMPKVYARPDQKPGATDTHYRVFVGNGALFDYVRGPKITEISDGTSNTIMVATAADAVPWTKPDELAFDPAKDMTKLLGFIDNGDVCMTAFGDGSVRAHRKTIKKENIIAMITKAGGEVFSDDDNE